MVETFFRVHGFLSDVQSCVLSSVELQVLTSSCFKLRTVHNIPVTSNKDGKELKSNFVLLCLVDLGFSSFTITNVLSPVAMPSGAVLSWLEPKSVFCPLSAKISHIMREVGGGTLQEGI